MPIIETREGYRLACEAIKCLSNVETGTLEDYRRDVLAMLVMEYAYYYGGIPPLPDVLDTIKWYLLEEQEVPLQDVLGILEMVNELSSIDGIAPNVFGIVDWILFRDCLGIVVN